MNFQLRKYKILEILDANDSVEVPDLALELGISEITVRRDLNILANENLLLRTHGGAVKIGLTKVAFSQKAEVNTEAKDEICKKAASLIQEGDVVFLDCGSTVFRICQYIKNKKIRIVTNSLPIVNELLGSEVHVNFAGGEIDADRQAAHGKIAVEHILRYKADLAFVGVDGISIANGLSANSENETEMTLAMTNNAKTVYFLCDSSKFEKDKYLPFAEISFVKNIITDAQIQPSLKEIYESKGVKFI
ncbi:DeoR/GlpR transcriptional regulator [Lacihabitans sp. CCS-44]|uniref:DeoR/GlpR family DNA-binding transcription regulator n=1 Tax=Lacihabitans sp. CCS-44 TaxID=2487331 RepID=UPI0020CCF92C|nr:DeoR/GlpR family DNA-binding transcription regulator [Lacihabitans sp. CCS-44]MCP9757508.1 DeoR/GlpR transcriptional regulator [Lacihabitans sp. CCS-44]